MSRELEALLEPISAESPCGVDLEDTQLLASFDAYRLFGSDTPLPADTAWRTIRERALDALKQSHDLRLLAHWVAAVLRLDGLGAFCEAMPVADRWLTENWDLVYPRVDDDAVLRKNALNCFADRMAIVDGVRRSAFASQRQLGSVSLRDVELAAGHLTATEPGADTPNAAQIEATLAGAVPEELAALAAQLRIGVGALRNIIATMQSRGSFESAPDFDPLLNPLLRIEQLLTAHLPSETGAMSDGAAEDAGGGARPGAAGEIKSRQDAIRAIDAASAFFRNNEPSSPVPLLLDRAKRLVSKSFMEVLEDIAPESLVQARLVGGLKSDEG